MRLFSNKDKEEEGETYEMEWECDNCGDSSYTYNIPKGTLFIDFLKNEICENCGCHIFLEEDKKCLE